MKNIKKLNNVIKQIETVQDKKEQLQLYGQILSSNNYKSVDISFNISSLINDAENSVLDEEGNLNIKQYDNRSFHERCQEYKVMFGGVVVGQGKIMGGKEKNTGGLSIDFNIKEEDAYLIMNILLDKLTHEEKELHKEFKQLI